MALYLIGSGPMQTTAAFATISTGTTIKTLLQIKPNAGVYLKIKEWGISFDGSAAATPGKVELIQTGVVFATVTASAGVDITKIDHPAGPAADTALVSLGTSATGYNASVEGTITAVRNFDLQLIAPTNQYVKQFPLGNEPIVEASSSCRIRVTFGIAVNAYCYIIFEG